MPQISPLDWIDKINNPDLIAFLEQFGQEHYLSAEEINELRDKVNSLVGRGNTITFPNEVLKYGDIGTDELEVHVGANAFNWRIDLIEFLNTPELFTVLDPATDGFYRADALLGNKTGGYQILKGTEDDTTAPEPTNLPEGTIRLGVIYIFGATITGTTIDINGLITKASKSFIRMFYTGHIDFVPVDDRSYLKFEQGMLSLKSLQISDSGFLYHGKDFIFKNGTTGNVTIYHNQGTGNFKFNFPNGQDFILKPEESVHIVMRAINYTNNGGLLDFVGLGIYKEELSNKKITIVGNEANDSFYGSIKAWIIYLKENWLSSLATKVTITDTTMFPVEDEADSNKAKVVSWLNIKNSITTFLTSIFQAKDNQVEISANSNVLNTWHGQTILFTANCTITVPATLNSSLMFPFRTLPGVTVTWAITSPHVWETTPAATNEKTPGHFMKRGATNTIILDV